MNEVSYMYLCDVIKHILFVLYSTLQKFFSAYNTLPENQCPYQPPEGPCHTDSTDDADGAGMTTAVNGLVFLMLANMFTLVFW